MGSTRSCCMSTESTCLRRRAHTCLPRSGDPPHRWPWRSRRCPCHQQHPHAGRHPTVRTTPACGRRLTVRRQPTRPGPPAARRRSQAGTPKHLQWRHPTPWQVAQDKAQHRCRVVDRAAQVCRGGRRPVPRDVSEVLAAGEFLGENPKHSLGRFWIHTTGGASNPPSREAHAHD